MIRTLRPLPWLRRKPALASAPAVLPAYRHDNALRRNRKKLGFALFLFVLIYVMAFQLFGRFIIVQFLLPYFFLFLLVIWALPERGTPPTGLLRGLFFAFAVALMLWPDYLALALPGLPWITALRLTGFPMLLIFMICLSISQEFRTEMKAILAPSRVVVRLIVTLAALFALSVLVSSNPALTLNRVIVVLVNLICIFFVASYVFSKPGMATRFVYVIWLVVLILAALTFWEVRHSQVPWAGRVPDFLKIEDEHVQRLLSGYARSTTGTYRAQSKFTTPVSFAEFLALSTPFVLHIAMTARRLWLRPFAWATLPLLFWMVLKTDSRLGVAGFLTTFILYLFVWAVLRWRSDRASIFGPAITIAYPLIFSMFVLATFFVGRLRNMVWGTGAHAPSNMAREVQWESGIPKILARPWGYGTGEGGKELGYTNPSGILTIDSYYLSILLDIGIIGFIVYYTIPILSAVRSMIYVGRAPTDEERLLAPVAVSLILFVISKSVLSQQEGHPLPFMLLGMAVALIYRVRKAEDLRNPA